MSFVELVVFGAIAGLGATLFADAIAILRQGWAMTHGFYCLVGRWVGSLPMRTVFHQDIRASSSVMAEALLGWGAHILIGITYGVCFAILFGPSAFDAPQLWQGLSFGVVTVLVPWLVFQPLFGWGVAMSKAPERWKMRQKGVITHTVFGTGIWLSAVLLGLAH